MTAYQAGIAKFEGMDVQVVAISTDNLPTLRHWSDEHIKASYPMASDFQRKVARLYGVLREEAGVANRTTFVVDTEGKIQHVEEGSGAMNPEGAATACSRIRKK